MRGLGPILCNGKKYLSFARSWASPSAVFDFTELGVPKERAQQKKVSLTFIVPELADAYAIKLSLRARDDRFCVLWKVGEAEKVTWKRGTPEPTFSPYKKINLNKNNILT